MSDETCGVICKALVVGAAVFTAYEIREFCMSQATLNYANYTAKESFVDFADKLTISLNHLLTEQIA